MQWRSLIGLGWVLVVAGGGAYVIDRATARELEAVRGMRVAILARAAAEEDWRPHVAEERGELSIVRGSESARYWFLNKRSYVVDTASVAREGTVLDGRDPADKARADRHAEVRRKKIALRVPLEDGRWRATVPANDLSSELILAPPPVPRPSVRAVALGAAVLGFMVLFVLRRRLPGIAGPSGALAAGGLLFLWIGPHLTQASLLATRYLAQDRPNVPIVSLPLASTRAALLALVIVSLAGAAFTTSSLGLRTGQALRRDRHAWLATAPALIGLFVLVGVPFAVCVGLSFFEHYHGTYSFVGLANFAGILRGSERGFFQPQGLGYSLIITIVWTGLNVSLHLSIGLLLALLLQGRAPRISKVYRVLLIIPWAVPAYLTALIWRSMFDPDVGLINRLLGREGMAWMHETSTAFLANLITNVWLGFPFMMVVCLGALTSIPKDLYEAADVDGASWWQQFVRITLPLLQPALLPAVILGSIWTFNKFEVIYLVSEGKPDGATDILVTEAYRWAFERGLAQGGAYGYAAAYSLIIFLVLLVYGWMTTRIARAAEEALR